MPIKRSSNPQSPALNAPAHEFLKTEAIKGLASSRTVKALIASMNLDGWAGEPISVIVIGSEKYILNGHHRVYAARQTSIPVLYNVIDESNLVKFGYSSTDEVIEAYAQAGPNRICPR